MNVSLPVGAQQSDIIAALLMAVTAAVLTPPAPTVTPTGAASTTYAYVVSANVNGVVVPSAAVQITTGAASLSAAAFNTISWQPLNIQLLAGSNFVPTYNVYRTAGGANQGLIASGLTLPVGAPLTAAMSFVDTGVSANTALTAPSFNTSGTLASGEQAPVLVLTGTIDAISIGNGTVYITTGSADATTLAAPIAGSAAAGGMDGCNLLVFGQSAFAHTITTPANCINGNKHIVTFTAAAMNYIQFSARNGVWYVSANLNGTLS